MRVLVAMSGGVDSSVAAALLVEAGEQVVGATMKLWGGPSDTGCCSVADVEDARRVSQQLGIPHHVFNFSEDFGRHVVDPYVADHAAGRTPNPCVECNRHLKFDRLIQRAQALGFDAVATGHYARVVAGADGRWSLLRGRDPIKDQSYVLHMLGQDQLSRIRLPVGDLTKDEVRTRAADLGLRTATKPDSQDVCFISRAGGREEFLGQRIDLRPGRIVDSSGAVIGSVRAIELVTIGQRRKLGALRPPASAAAMRLVRRRLVRRRLVRRRLVRRRLVRRRLVRRRLVRRLGQSPPTLIPPRLRRIPHAQLPTALGLTAASAPSTLQRATTGATSLTSTWRAPP